MRSLEHYQGLFPGYSGEIAAEFHAAATRVAALGDGLTATLPRTPAEATLTGTGEPQGREGPGLERIGSYVLLRELGRGGMGVVYEARDDRLPRRVALKVLAPRFASSLHLRMRFEREAAIASRLDHPHICTVYEAGESGGVPFMAMRFVEGRPLSDHIAATRDAAPSGGKGGTGVVRLPRAGEEGPAPPGREGSPSAGGKPEGERVLRFFAEAAMAIHAAQEKGLIHRDIKPHNIMVADGGHPVILDFGLARAVDDDGQPTLTRAGSVMGTPAYMSPEQVEAAREELDRRTDVYSLGVSLYEALTLRLPFEAPTLEGLYREILTSVPGDPTKLNPRLPRDLRVILATAMDRDRGRRYRTALDLAEELDRVVDRVPILARPAGPLLRLARWAQRSPAIAGTGAALFLSLAIGLAVALNLLDAETVQRKAKEAAVLDVTRERDDKAALLRVARSRALVNESILAEEGDPMLSLLLAREAARAAMLPAAVARLHDAVRVSTEEATFTGQPGQIVWAGFNATGDRILSTSNGGDVRVRDLGGREILAVMHPEAAPRYAVLFPDGKRLVTAGPSVAKGRKGWSAILWDGEGRALETWDVHGVITVGLPVAVSPAGDLVATAGTEGSIELRDRDGTLLGSLRGHRSPAHHVAFFPDGTRLLSVSASERAVRVWSVAGECLATAADLSADFRFAVPSPDGKTFLVGGDGGAVLWSSAGARMLELGGHGKAIAAAGFLGAGGGYFTASYDGKVRIWDGQGRMTREFAAHRLQLSGARLSPGGDRLLTFSTGEREACVWNLQGDRLARISGHLGELWAADVAPDGERVVTASDDPAVKLFQVHPVEAGRWAGRGDHIPSLSPAGGESAVVEESGAAVLRDSVGMVRASLEIEGEAIAGVFHSADGTRLATVSSSRRADLWDAEGTRIGSLQEVTEAATPVPWDSGGGFLTLSRREAGGSLMRTWSPEGRRLGTAELPGRGSGVPVNDIGRSATPAGTRLLVRVPGQEGVCAVLDETGAERFRLDSMGQMVMAAFSPDGDRVVVCNPLKFRTDLRDGAGKVLAVLSGGKGGATGVLSQARFSPSGDSFVGVDTTGEVGIWSRDGKREFSTKAHSGPILKVEFSRSGDRFVTASLDGTMRIWDRRGKALGVVREARVEKAVPVFSPAGDRIATLGLDGAIGIWDIQGNSHGKLRVSSGRPARVAFDAAGSRLLAATTDGKVHSWFLRGEDLLALADRRITRGLTEVERARYADLLGDAPPR